MDSQCIAKKRNLERKDSLNLGIIGNCKSAALINEDSSIDVEERILMDFAYFERHGLKRNIPFAYGANEEYTEVNIEFLSVMDENFEAYNYSKEKLCFC